MHDERAESSPCQCSPAPFAKLWLSAGFLSSLPQQANWGFFFSTSPCRAQIPVSSWHPACSQGQLGHGCQCWTASTCCGNRIHHQKELGRRSVNPAAGQSWLLLRVPSPTHRKRSLPIYLGCGKDSVMKHRTLGIIFFKILLISFIIWIKLSTIIFNVKKI